MLTPRQLEGLSWHPLRDVGRRGPNYALSTLGLQEGAIVYLMACGHESVPGHTRCKHDCGRDPPNYRMPYVQHEDWRIAAKTMDRYGVEKAEDLSRLPSRMRPDMTEARMPILFHRENTIDPRRIA